MVSVSSTADLLAALHRAGRITFCSYVLRPGQVEQALEAAAKRGACVQVRLDGYLWGGSDEMHDANARAIAALKSAGADAKLVHLRDDDGPGLHMKAAVCDGVAFLDDCNWNGGKDAVLRDTGRTHVSAIRRAALQHDVPPKGRLALTKSDALDAEAAVIQRAGRGDEVDVESEALHDYSAITSALRKAAKNGAYCRVLVSELSAKRDAKTAKAITSLEKAGIDVRTVRSSEKLAIAGRSRAWVGSADATSTQYDANQIEWSLHSDSSQIVHALESRFNAHWKASAAPS